MQSTPAHDLANPELLAVMPGVESVIEVGCSRGALASAYKRGSTPTATISASRWMPAAPPWRARTVTP